jgi:putative solute:sodium symporter small subunit
MSFDNSDSAKSYWRDNLKIMTSLLLVWFTVSFGFGILLVDQLNTLQLGGFKLGFWFAQQGSIYIFVVLIFIYIAKMNRLDKKYHVQED